jgi:oligopeptide transport system permease protein
MMIIPVIILALLMLSFNLFGDGLRDALDPTMKEM